VCGTSGRITYRLLVGKPKKKTVRPIHRYDTIKMGLKRGWDT
jgi:hypothetical protein